MPRLSRLLLLCVCSTSVRSLNLGGPSVSDPASGAACYTNTSACEAAAANVGLCGNAPSAQPCVAAARSYCAFAGSSNIWYCPNATAPAADVSYSVDSLTGTPCHASSARCGSLVTNSCSAAQCVNGALSACAFTASGVFVWYCPHDLGTGQALAPASVQMDVVSNLLCYTTEQECEAAPANACASGGGTCVFGASTGCGYTSGQFNWYCPLGAPNASALLVAQVDPTSQLTCYFSAADCELAASTLCGSGAGEAACTDGQSSYCAYSGPRFHFYCPLNTGGLPDAVAGSLVPVYQVDGVTGVACFISEAMCEGTASTTCGPTSAGYSGVSCAIGSTSSCAFVANTAYSWFCPNSLGADHIAADSQQVDPVSSLPCYTTGAMCASAASNPCIAPIIARLASNATGANATAPVPCVDGSDTLCAFTSGAFNWYCPPRGHASIPVYAQQDPVSGLSCYDTAANCALTAGNSCVSPGSPGVLCQSAEVGYCAFAGHDYSYYCPLSVLIDGAPAPVAAPSTSDLAASEMHSTLYQIDSVSSLPCFLSADHCQSTGTNTCGRSLSGKSGVLCEDGYESACAFTTYAGYRYYCPNAQTSQLVGGGATIAVQLDSKSGAPCYRSAALCRSGAGNACDSLNIDCVGGANTACAFAGGDGGFTFYCPHSVNASAVGVYRQFDPVSGIACFDSAADCAAAGSNACGTTAQGFSGSLCLNGASSFCAFSGGPFVYYCPLSPAAQAMGASYAVDAASGQPCYSSQSVCESTPVNTCGPLSAAASGISCSNAGATCASAAGLSPGTVWYCPNMVGSGRLGSTSAGSRVAARGAAVALALAWAAGIQVI